MMKTALGQRKKYLQGKVEVSETTWGGIFETVFQLHNLDISLQHIQLLSANIKYQKDEVQ